MAISTRLVTIPVDVSHSDDAAPSTTIYTPTLSAFISAANYKVLFDQYKVLKLTLHFAPNCVQVSQVNSKSSILAVCCPDYDDAGTIPDTLTGLGDLLMKPGCAIHQQSGAPWAFSIVPRVLRELVETAATGTETIPMPWISTSSDTTVLHGIKTWFGNPFTNVASVSGQLWLEIDVEFRGQHSANALMVARGLPASANLPPKDSKLASNDVVPLKEEFIFVRKA